MSPETRTVARSWTPGGDRGLLMSSLEWQPAGLAVPFKLDVGEFFEDASG